MSQQIGCRQVTLNGRAGNQGLRDGLTAAAGQLQTHVADDPDAGQRVVEHFAHTIRYW